MCTIKNDSLVETILEKISYYLKSHKDVACSAVIAGFLSHMYAITNKLPNGDDVTALLSKGASVTSGRWFLDFTSIIFPDYSMPWIYGCICILLISIVACIIVDFLDIKNTVFRIITGALFTSFPTITGFLCFMFTAAPYCLGLLLASCALVLFKNGTKAKYVIGIVLLTVSTGIYQMCFIFASAMLVIFLIKRLMVDDYHCKQIFKDGIKYLLFLIISVSIYYMIQKLTNCLLNIPTENADYALSDAPIYRRILTTYTAMFGIFFKGYFSYVRTPLSVVFHCILILILIYTCIMGIIEDKHRIGMLFLLFIIWPVSVNMLYLIASPGVIHVLSQFPFITFYLLVIVLSEKHLKFKDITSICLSVIVILNIYAANATYLKLSLNYENAYSFYTSLLADISQVDGYSSDMKIVFNGKPDKGIYFGETSPEEITMLVIPVTDYYSTTQIINRFLGRDLTVSYINDTDLASDMNVYPSSNSIVIKDNTVFVNFLSAE